MSIDSTTFVARAGPAPRSVWEVASGKSAARARRSWRTRVLRKSPISLERGAKIQPRAGPRRPQDGFRRPKTAREPPKTAQEPPQDGQDGPKRLPRRPQEGPKRPQDGPRTAPRTPKTAQDAPETPPRTLPGAPSFPPSVFFPCLPLPLFFFLVFVSSTSLSPQFLPFTSRSFPRCAYADRPSRGRRCGPPRGRLRSAAPVV